MIVQLNADNNLNIREAYAKKLNDLLSSELDRFTEFLTRIEAYFSDVNGSKTVGDDKLCKLEVRIKGKQPIVVSDIATTYDKAIAGALHKLKVSLNTVIGKMRTH